MKVSCSLDDMSPVLPWKPLRHQRKQLQRRFRAQQAVAEMAWWLAPSLATLVEVRDARRHSYRDALEVAVARWEEKEATIAKLREEATHLELGLVVIEAEATAKQQPQKEEKPKRRKETNKNKKEKKRTIKTKWQRKTL